MLNLRTLVILVALICGACSKNINEEVRNAFAFVRTDIASGSGFAIDQHTLITSCHVIDGDTQAISVKTYDNRVANVTNWWCDKNLDIAFLKVKEDIFSDVVEVKHVEDGVYHGCIFGSWSKETSILKDCGKATVSKTKIKFNGTIARPGMSGGPCVVMVDGQYVVAGVIRTTYQPPWKKHEDREVSCERISYTHWFIYEIELKRN